MRLLLLFVAGSGLGAGVMVLFLWLKNDLPERQPESKPEAKKEEPNLSVDQYHFGVMGGEIRAGQKVKVEGLALQISRHNGGVYWLEISDTKAGSTFVFREDPNNFERPIHYRRISCAFKDDPGAGAFGWVTVEGVAENETTIRFASLVK